MSVQKGFDYERYLYECLKKDKIAAGNPPAGAESNRPDLEIKLASQPPTKKEGCELKLAPTAGGSLVMKYTDGKWGFDSKAKEDKEKAFMMEVAKKANLLREMNTSGGYGNNWRGKVPFQQNDKNTGKKLLVGRVRNAKEAYDKDIKQFGGQNEVKIPVQAKVMCDYYNLKDTHYLNVASHGFFLMNSKDPLGLNKKLQKEGHLPIPDFANSAQLKIRVRCQYKGSGSYQFSMTLEFGGVRASPYNLGPIQSKTNVQINKRELYNSQNAPLLEVLKT
tara:strand:+ start:18094 stop:18924 length:831 start_codon:yes stop_codon:yes gene_type:complete